MEGTGDDSLLSFTILHATRDPNDRKLKQAFQSTTMLGRSRWQKKRLTDEILSREEEEESGGVGQRNPVADLQQGKKAHAFTVPADATPGSHPNLILT